MSTETIVPKQLDESSIPDALLLSQEAGWNQTAADWRVFFTHGTVLGVTIGNRLVGTAAALPYGDAFGWISMVLVTAEQRGQGLATRLVSDCTSILREAGRAALLDAAANAIPIYSKLGYAPLCAMQRWEGPGGGESTPEEPVDFALDETAFGADRRFLLEDFLTRPGSLVFRTPQGFAIARAGLKTYQIGPVVAGEEEARMLIAEAIRATPGRVAIDVLDAGEAALNETLIARGFRRQRGFMRMALGISALPGDPSLLLAAAGPEFG